MTTSDPRPHGSEVPRSSPSSDRPDPTEPTDPSTGAGGSHTLRPSPTPVPSPPGADDAFPVPHGPRTTGPGGHLVGVLIGLVLTGAALVVLLLGQSRILAGGVREESISPDALGIALVTIGSVLAALAALLAVRTSAIPFTGGLLGLLVGAAYLFAPAAAHRQTVRLLATEQNRDAILTMAGVAVAGTPFAVGLVLLATGTAASLVRRRGIEVGSFRARTAGQGSGSRS